MARSSCRPPKSKSGGRRFVTFFRHWRTGRIYYAADYGYKAWPIG